jgi:FkbM family methyltransferase
MTFGRFSKLLKITKQDGLTEAAQRLKSFLSFRISRRRRKVQTWYWDNHGSDTQTLVIGSHSADFESSTAKGGPSLRWGYDSEQGIIRDLLNELNEDDVFFDIGSNVGLYSCFASGIVTSGKIISFEPSPANVKQLKRNLELNSRSGTYQIMDIALGDCNQFINFTCVGHDVGQGTANISPIEETIEVEMFSGDELINAGAIPQPNVIKLDVEGAEPLVIQGLKDCLGRPGCRVVYLEIHLPVKNGRPSIKDYGENEEGLMNQLGQLGFEVVSSRRRGSEIHIKATKPDEKSVPSGA